MTFLELKQKTRYYDNVFTLERLIQHRSRLWLKKLFFIMSFVLYTLTLGIFVTTNAQLFGFFYLVLCFFLAFVAMDALYYSFAYAVDAPEPYLFEFSSILSETKTADIVGSFARSHVGNSILMRCGIDASTRNEYLHKRTVVVGVERIDFPKAQTAFESYLLGLYNADQNFTHLLTLHRLSAQDFVECAKLAIRLERKREDSHRWWGNKEKRNLAATSFLELLEHRAHIFEKESNFVVSYPALTNALHHLLTDEDEEGTTRDVLWEAAESAHDNGRRIIYQEDIHFGIVPPEDDL